MRWEQWRWCIQQSTMCSRFVNDQPIVHRWIQHFFEVVIINHWASDERPMISNDNQLLVVDWLPRRAAHLWVHPRACVCACRSDNSRWLPVDGFLYRNIWSFRSSRNLIRLFFCFFHIMQFTLQVSQLSHMWPQNYCVFRQISARVSFHVWFQHP